MATKRPAKQDDRIIVIETKQVPISSLRGYHKNPRVGDVDAIAISLDTHGQYRPILVNIGTHTGRKNEILAGNHTYLGARKELSYKDGSGTMCKKEAWKNIYASFVDVNEETAAKIVLADNKLADRGEYEDSILAELFANIPDITGTGYDQHEVDDILASIEVAAPEESVRSISDLMGDMPDELPGQEPVRSQRQQIIEEETEERREVARARGAARPEPDADAEAEVEQIDASAELQVVLELKEENLYLGDNHWGIPELRPELLMKRSELPGDLKTWGGHEATPDDGKQWYFYQYGLGGKKGLPIDRSILSFFCQDARFISWWDLPAYHTARFISEGLKYVVVPDFSFYSEEARAHHLQSQYRAQWLGRFFQEAGLKVIPRLQFDFTDHKHGAEIGMIGLPRGGDLLATSQQNMSNKEDEANCAAILADALQELKPKTLLIYGGNPAKRVGEKVAKHVEEVIWIENYAAVRRATVFGQKTGAAKLTKKQKDALIEKHGGKKTGITEPDDGGGEYIDED